MPIRQGSGAWLQARRALVTATDIPVLLGLSPYKCEADLADEKLTGHEQPQTLRMRTGLAMEPVIADEYARRTERRLRRFHNLVIHPDLKWAGASPDYGVVGEKRLVEIKWTGSRSRFADGLPQDVEAQVAWQLAVTGYPVADVAVLAGDELLPPFEVEANPALFDNLVAIAADFRRRLDAGGPFSRDLNRVRRDYPADDGSEISADDELTEAVHSLSRTRGEIASLEQLEDILKTAIQERMGPASVLIGPDFRATWRRTRDSETTDYKSLATSLLSLVPETERAPLVGLHTSVRPGMRPFRLTMEGTE